MVSCKIRVCSALQFLADLILFCICFGTISFTIYAKYQNLGDARLILAMGCLESDSPGYVFVVISLGTCIITAMTLIACLGAYSCLKQRPELLYCYSAMGYVLVFVELLYFITLFIHLGRATAGLTVCMKDVLVQYYSGPYRSQKTEYSGAWDFLQRKYHCCGVDGGKVFNSMVNWNRTWADEYVDIFFNTSLRLEEFKVITAMPYTCCIFKEGDNSVYDPAATEVQLRLLLLDPHCPTNPTKSNSYITYGCFDILRKFIQDMTTVIFSISLILEMLQMAAVLAALYWSRVVYNTRLREQMKKERLID